MFRTSASAARWIAVGVLLTWFAAAGTAQAARDVFIRSKPHVRVGTVGGDVMQIRLHANVHVDSDTGDASGPLQLRLATGEKLHYHAIAAEVVASDAGTIVLLFLKSDADGSLGLAIVRSHPTMADCLIYDIVGPNVQVVAEGTIELREEKRR